MVNAAALAQAATASGSKPKYYQGSYIRLSDGRIIITNCANCYPNRIDVMVNSPMKIDVNSAFNIAMGYDEWVSFGYPVVPAAEVDVAINIKQIIVCLLCLERFPLSLNLRASQIRFTCDSRWRLAGRPVCHATTTFHGYAGTAC